MTVFIETQIRTITEVPNGEDTKSVISEVHEKHEKMQLIAATMGGKWEGGVQVHTRHENPPTSSLLPQPQQQ